MPSDNDNEEIGGVNNNSPDTANTPGARLRIERERRGLSLHQVAGEMHMDIRVAQALEKDDYSPLGAPIFVKGHLRNYAKLLGLPADALINDYEQMATPQTPELMTNRPTVGSMDQAASNGAGWFVGIGIFLIIVLLACLAWWVYGQRNDIDGALPDMSFPEASQPADTVNKPGADTTSQPLFENTVAQVDPLAPEKQVLEKTTQDQPESQENTPAADESVPQSGTAVTKKETAANKKPAEIITPVSLALTFTEDSWVEVYGMDGKPVLYELGQAGQVRQLQVKPPVRIFLGNAPAVEVSVNGKPFDISSYLRADSTARFTLQGEQ